MASMQQYQNAKKKLVTDKKICAANRKLFQAFFIEQERKLKRINDLPELDNNTLTTLCDYTYRLRNVNKWFKNKPLTKITQEDIRRVYDDLEDGKIKNKYGNRYVDRASYYNKIFKSTLFEMAGDKHLLAKKVIKFIRKTSNEVRYITEEDFRKLLQFVNKPDHLLLFWLAFDIGENISALLQLKKSDLTRLKDKDTGESEYRVRLRNETLKRTRRARSELTNYLETVSYLDVKLKDLSDDDLLFAYGYRNAKKIITRAVERSGIKCRPNGEKVTWKDLRSGMSCDLLNKGWTRDEVNSRLGHAPSSTEIDKYINFFALDKHKTKKKVQQHRIGELQEELEEMKRREKLQSMRYEELKDKLADVHKQSNKRVRYMTELALELTKLRALMLKEPKHRKELLEGLSPALVEDLLQK